MPLHWNEKTNADPYAIVPDQCVEDSVNSNTSQPAGPEDRQPFQFQPTGTTPKYLSGTLAEVDSIPYRGAGVAAHGIDIDTTQDEWNNHSLQGDDGQAFEVWETTPPLVVTVVDMPIETAEKYSRIIPCFTATELYTFTTVGVLDNNPVRTILPKDDTRKSATIIAQPSPAALAAGGTAQYAFLISNDQQCLTGVLLGGNGTLAGPNMITLLGKSPVFARIVPLLAYDVTKTNNYSLVAITETALLGSRRVR